MKDFLIALVVAIIGIVAWSLPKDGGEDLMPKKKDKLNVLGVGRARYDLNEVTLYFDRPLTNDEMLVIRDRVEKVMNPRKK